MTETRTWLTTPTGGTPSDDEVSAEYWVPGPTVPDEPRPPSRFRGAIVLLSVLVVVVGLTFVLAPIFVDVQDPTFSGEPGQRLDETDFDTTFERPTSN